MTAITLQHSLIERPGKHIAGFFGMLLGPILVFGVVLFMNRYGDELEKNQLPQSTTMEVAKQEKPKTKKVQPKPKPKAQPKQMRAPPAPFSGLDSSLSGIDLGLPGLGMEDMNAVDNSLLGKTQASVMTEDSVDTPPQPRFKGNFIYPKSAKKRGIEGYVVMSILIGMDGSVEQVQVLESSPAGVFDETAVMGIKTWRFSPAQYQGQPVKVWAKQRVRFGLG